MEQLTNSKVQRHQGGKGGGGQIARQGSVNLSGHATKDNLAFGPNWILSFCTESSENCVIGSSTAWMDRIKVKYAKTSIAVEHATKVATCHLNIKLWLQIANWVLFKC